MCSRPGMGREYDDGYVLVTAETPEAASERAKDRAHRVHGHRDWVALRVDALPD